MLKLLGWLIKGTIFAIIVLVLGNYVRWNGRTVSDQVKTGLAQAERSGIATQVKHFVGASDSVTPARAGGRGGMAHGRRKGASEAGSSSSEEIPASERQKLKALIHELNS